MAWTCIASPTLHRQTCETADMEILCLIFTNLANGHSFPYVNLRTETLRMDMPQWCKMNKDFSFSRATIYKSPPISGPLWRSLQPRSNFLPLSLSLFPTHLTLTQMGAAKHITPSSLARS